MPAILCTTMLRRAGIIKILGSRSGVGYSVTRLNWTGSAAGDGSLPKNRTWNERQRWSEERPLTTAAARPGRKDREKNLATEALGYIIDTSRKPKAEIRLGIMGHYRRAVVRGFLRNIAPKRRR